MARPSACTSTIPLTAPPCSVPPAPFARPCRYVPDAFFVLYGDSYLTCDYAAVESAFRAAGLPGLMTVYRNEGLYDTSNMEYRDGRILGYDKRTRTPSMRHIDYGLGVFDRRVFGRSPKAELRDLASVYQDLLAAGQLAAFEVRERFYESAPPKACAIQSVSGPNTRNLRKAGRFNEILARSFLFEVEEIARRLDDGAIEKTAALLAAVRERSGRLFILGVGGSAANASHAVNDFRKIVGIETYAPTDNVSELTARTNDEGWPTIFESWLRVSRLQRARRHPGLLGGRRQSGAQRQPEYRGGPRVRQIRGSLHPGDRRPRWRLYRAGGGCLRDHPHGASGPHYAAFGSLPGHRLAPAGLAPRAPANRHPLGIARAPMTRRAVFLDRDGVINEAVIRNGKPYPPASPDAVRIPEGTAAALARLKAPDFCCWWSPISPTLPAVRQQRATVEAIASASALPFPWTMYSTCYHDDRDNCDCRKPRPGLILQAAGQYGIDLAASFLIGDRWRDIDAGAAAGCSTIWIDAGYRERSPTATPDAQVTSLPEAVAWILAL